ncbi:hypothetical protein JRO89_XS02G0031800 [Xanthoceras sorbifolium]|uniref:Uncharacterized protein n=1 Tax=Xanthoceras sorbifolium TaxID=99658 RepID=A0ABQ8IE97_9ROSI|nr:hypothetical protein JRO89_XS02G0031800 [Xanthoceras sorbifolium]
MKVIKQANGIVVDDSSQTTQTSAHNSSYHAKVSEHTAVDSESARATYHVGLAQVEESGAADDQHDHIWHRRKKKRSHGEDMSAFPVSNCRKDDQNIKDYLTVDGRCTGNSVVPTESVLEMQTSPLPNVYAENIATTDDYDEYCHYSAEIVEIGLFMLFNPSQKQDPLMEKLCGSTSIFYQDLKCEENSIKTVQYLNEMVTDALKHTGDCLNHLSTLNDDAALQFFGALAVKGMGTLVLCYSNIQVFKNKVRYGLAARLYE